MAYDISVVTAARRELERRRTAAESLAAARREELTARLPRLGEIERELAATLPQITHIILNKGDPAAIDILQRQNLALQQEMADLLHAAGCDFDSFEPQYTCPLCRDTGYAEGRTCRCYEQLLQTEACRRLSGLSAVKLTDFDSMDLTYYDSDIDPRLGVSPRRRMEDIIAYCRSYVADFTPHSDSLLLLGATGTGKTHLSLAIARGVTERGFGVVYGSMQPLLKRLEADHFGRGEGGTEEQLTACDLLVLDDLGMEFDSPFNRSCIYNILNARLLEERPTIISTNLSAAALKERYGDQITSRIIGGFQPLLCVGKDIRQLRRQRAMG